MTINEQGDELLALMGSKVRERRTQLGLSPDELARCAGIGVDFLREIEAGRQGMTVENFFAVKQTLQVSFGYLFGEG